MPTVTTAELVARAKAISDMHDNFVTPEEWMYWATQERLSLDYLMARSGWIQNVTEVTVTTNGAGNYDLGLIPLAVLCVHESSSQGLRRLRYNNAVDFKRQNQGSTLVTGAAVEYCLKLNLQNEDAGLIINFFPEPPSGSYVVSIIPGNLPLSLTPILGYERSVLYPQGWEERIVLGMARRALIKEESDVSNVSRLIASVEAEIERAVWNMVTSEAPIIRNGDAQHYGWDRDIYYPPSVQWRWF